MSDPYRTLPNLSGETAAGLEEAREGDSSRFYTPPGSGQMDAVTARILNVPACKAWRSGGMAAVGGGGSLVITWDVEEYDTDGMVTLNSQFVTVKTRGYYVATSTTTVTTGAGPRWSRILKNNDTALPIAQCATANAGVYATIHNLTSYPTPMNPGDTLAVIITPGTDSATPSAGQANMWLSANFVKSFGSDAQ